VSARRAVFEASQLATAAAAGLWIALWLGLPRVASACAVCTTGRDDESNAAFLISTIFLSVLPLAALGTLVFVIWRRVRRLEAATGTTSSRAAAVADPASAVSVALSPPSPAR
jgi:predicted Na+-dependent transporter